MLTRKTSKPYLPDSYIVRGNIINPKSDNKWQEFPDGVLWIENKKIKFCDTYAKWQKTLHKMKNHKNSNNYCNNLDSIQEYHYGNHFIIPTFFDMHFHWVQDHVSPKPKKNLLNWLNHFTFPAEKKFSSPEYSQKQASLFFKKLQKAGTFGGMIFSSIHECALESAYQKSLGDFVIGNVVMTQNSPAYLTQSKKAALRLVQKWAKLKQTKYAFTPRFAIATDLQTMKEGGELALKNNSFIQTHLSENKSEINFVLSLYQNIFSRKNHLSKKNKPTYTGIYQHANLLGPKSFFAHGIHLSDEELKLLKKSHSNIVHCPTSNAPIKQNGLGSGLFPLDRINQSKINWALGSDIGAGPLLCMLDVIQSFLIQHKNHSQVVSMPMALYRSTLAGAKLLNLSDETGNLDQGLNANFLIIKNNLKSKNENLSLIQCLEKNILSTKRSQLQTLIQHGYYHGQKIF